MIRRDMRISRERAGLGYHGKNRTRRTGRVIKRVCAPTTLHFFAVREPVDETPVGAG